MWCYIKARTCLSRTRHPCPAYLMSSTGDLVVSVHGRGAYCCTLKCPFCKHYNEDDGLLTSSLYNADDTFWCWNCHRMCFLVPGDYSRHVAQIGEGPLPDINLPVTPIVRCTVDRHESAGDEEWYWDPEEDDATAEDKYTKVCDVRFSPPVWDITKLLQKGLDGEPPRIRIGDRSILWDADGRARTGRWFAACLEGGLVVP